MAKQWKHTFSKFYNGETDDSFIPTGDKYLSSTNIEPVLHPRYLELSNLLLKQYALTTTSDIISITTIPWGGRIDLSASEAFYNWTSITSTVWASGYSYCGYLYNTSWALKNFFFSSDTNIYRLNADCSTNEATIAKATWAPTAVCQNANTILFAIGNIIYKIDNASIVATALATVPYGSVIKKIYVFNDILYIFTQLWPDVKIYQASYDWSAYSITYIHTKEDVSIYDMAWSGWDMYWISNIWLYQTSWIDSKRIKNQTFTSAARCSIYRDDRLYIIDTAYVYRYGSNIPWFPKAFVKVYEHNASMVVIEWQLFYEARISWESDLLAFESARYAGSGNIVTMPYDAWALWAEKNLNVIDFPYELKTGKTWASIQIQCQTNLMELNNAVTYINLRTLNTLNNATQRCRIDRQEIIDALSWENPDFNYIRFKIILTWGDLDWGSRAQYSPKVYQDILISWNFLNDAETYL